MKTKVQLALSVFLDEWMKHIQTKAKQGHMGAVKALSMFYPMKPILIRELRNLSDDDAEKLVSEVRRFLKMVEE